MNCPNCGAKIQYNGVPCPNCGHIAQAAETKIPSAPYAPGPSSHDIDTPSYSDQSSYTKSAPYGYPYKKPSKKKWLIPLIVLLVCLAATAVAVPLALSDKEDSSSIPVFSDTANLPESSVSSEPISQVSSIPSISQPEEESEASVSTVPTEKTGRELAAEVIPYFDLKYWLNQCTNDELQIICEIYQSIAAYEETCKLSSEVKVDDLTALISLMTADCPELFHYENFSYYYQDDDTVTQKLGLKYNMTQAEYTSARSACETVLQNIYSATQNMTDLQKEKYIFDYIVSDCYYDKTTEHSGSAYGVFVERIAKCDGFAWATKWAMDTVGVPCLYVAGDAVQKGEEGHAWNMVCLDGAYYLLDVTLCTPLRGEEDIRDDQLIYMCFNISDQWHLDNYVVDETFASRNLPRCTTLKSCYYALSGQMVLTGEDPYPKMTAGLDSSADPITAILQFESSADYNDFLQNLDSYVTEWTEQNEIYSYRYQYHTFDFDICILIITPY